MSQMRQMIAAAVVVSTLAVAATANAQQITLRIGNYGGLFTELTQKCAGDLYTSRTGNKVRYLDGNPSDHLAKLLAAQGKEAPYDLVYLDDGPYAQGLDAGLFDKLDPAIVTNLKFLYPIARMKDDYSAAANTSSVGLAYNTKILKERGIPEPTSWADLWNPKLAGRIALPDITTSAGMNMVMVAAWQVGGDEKDLKNAFQKLAEIKPLYFFKSSADLKTKFQSGEVWVAPWYNGRSWQLISEGFPMKFIYPGNRGFAQLTTINVIKGTKYSKEAMAYVDAQLDPLAQLCMATYLPYGPTNSTLDGVMAAYPKMSQQFPSPEDLKSRMYVANWSIVNRDFPKWLEMWNRTVIK